jgi:hypothetical protein
LKRRDDVPDRREGATHHAYEDCPHLGDFDRIRDRINTLETRVFRGNGHSLEVRMTSAEKSVAAFEDIAPKVQKFLNVMEDREKQGAKHMNAVKLILAILTVLIAWMTYDRTFNEPTRTQTVVEQVYDKHEAVEKGMRESK